MAHSAKYVDCMLITGGRHLARSYTYSLPDEWAEKVVKGSLLLVPARKKLRLGVAMEFPSEPEVKGVKAAVALYDGPPIVNEKQIDAASWIQRYYVTPPLSALKPFLLETKALKIVEKIKPVDPKIFSDILNEQGFLFLKRDSADLIALGESVHRRTLEKFLAEGGFDADIVEGFITNCLLDGILELDFSLENKRRVTRGDTIYTIVKTSGENLDGLTPKQKTVVDFIREKNGASSKEKITSSIKGSGRILGLLVKKEILAPIRRSHYVPDDSSQPEHELTQRQDDAIGEIGSLMDSDSSATVLLHGVTGSGKTEVYVKAAHQALNVGRQVIVLVPEIALTHQVVRRFARDFPGLLAILHSELSESDRIFEWQRIRSGEAKIVIGARSALFCPVDNLGLIVLDEEHEPSYKQSAMPRYHARELARRLAMAHKAVLILGSATPSMESYHLARTGHFKLIELPERISGAELPEIELVKRKFELVELPGGRTGKRLEIITGALREGMEDVLGRNKQVLLFLNQRGYARCLICPECGKTFDCPDCCLPLVHHTKSNSLLCHHCSHRRAAPNLCPRCGDVKLVDTGIGTQRLEEDITRLFPDQPLHRLDRDVSDAKGGSGKIIEDFRTGRSRILLGTQMIAKGLDIADVELVGVISAEDSLAIPDFRAPERTFQLLTQVAGRAGRRDIRGRVIVQGIRLDHYSVTAACKHDYHMFFEQESEIRKRYNYPPYTHLARIVISSAEHDRTAKAAEVLGKTIRGFGKDVPQVEILGPAPAQIEKLRGLWRRHMLFRSERVGHISRLLRSGLAKVSFPGDIRIEVDIDPLHLI